jgi:hypothetical protein
MLSLHDALLNLNIDHVDLVSMNIEGAEYNVLNRLIDTGSIKRINYIL